MSSQQTCSEQADPACRNALVNLEYRGEASNGSLRRRSQIGSHRVTRAIALVLLFACIALPGCSICLNAKRTICGEPSEYWWLADRKRSVAIYREWADSAWCQHGNHNCGQSVSTAYEVGFKDGFVDYVFAGGAGEPPPVPPRQFWNVCNRNPDGHAEAEQWFAGFRHGAQVAHNEGYREQTVVPASAFFGPEQDCWEDQPCCEQPYLTPIPSSATPELLPPGQVEPEEQAGEFSPLLPSVESDSVDQPKSSKLLEEEMPIPDTGMEQTTEPQIPELSPPPATIPESSPKLAPPPTPESEQSIDNIFGAAAPKRKALNSRSRLRTKSSALHHTDPKVQKARAAFSAAIRRSQNKGQLIASPAEEVPLQQATSHRKPTNSSQAVIRINAAQLESAVRQSHHVTSPRPSRVSRSDDRAEEMFRRLSK